MNTKWECRICQSQNDASYAFCVQCYLGLHYYSYVNMHMFVESDNSFQELYSPSKSEVSSECASQCSNDSFS